MSVTTTWNQNLRDLCCSEQDHPKQLLKSDLDLNMSSQDEEEPTNLQLQLLSEAAAVRAKIGPLFSPPSAEELSFASSFSHCQPDHHPRGFCNWLIPGRLMMGQYPGQNPLKDGPTWEESASHLQCMAQAAGVSVFCSLQRETPAQDNNSPAWDDQGRCYLQPEAIRRQLPRPFTQYAPQVREYSEEEVVFLHVPIEDLSVPECQEPLQKLLLELLQQLNHQRTIYIHCWGGRGRAGLVGACLLALLWPNLTSSTVLQWVQRGYSTRAGHEWLAPEYASSPQTCGQRDYVRGFVQQYQSLHQRQQSQEEKVVGS